MPLASTLLVSRGFGGRSVQCVQLCELQYRCGTSCQSDKSACAGARVTRTAKAEGYEEKASFLGASRRGASANRCVASILVHARLRSLIVLQGRDSSQLLERAPDSPAMRDDGTRSDHPS